MEKQIKREDIYQGKVIHVVKDDVLCPNGNYSKREIVMHRGGACIALYDPDDDKFFTVRQYRYAFNEELIEFCAGKLEENEKPLDAIKREVKEELGYEANDIKAYGYIIPTCGYSNEKIYLYSGIKGKYVGQHFDNDEDMSLEKYSLSELKEMVKDNRITDAKTIALIYHLAVI